MIEQRANELLADPAAIRTRRPGRARCSRTTSITAITSTPYVDDLDSVLDMDVIRESGLHIGADPMGGSGVAYWQPIAEKYGLNLERGQHQRGSHFSFHVRR